MTETTENVNYKFNINDKVTFKNTSDEYKENNIIVIKKQVQRSVPVWIDGEKTFIKFNSYSGSGFGFYPESELEAV